MKIVERHTEVARALTDRAILPYEAVKVRDTSAGRAWSLPSLRWIEKEGSGLPLLFLHGVCRCAEDFEVLWPHLPPESRIMAADHRGHGGSKCGSRYCVVDYVSDAIDLLRRHIAEPVIIHGHSLGAMVAAAVAVELPELVRGIILEDPPFHTMGRDIHGTNWQLQFKAMYEIAVRKRPVWEIVDALSEIRLSQRDGTTKRLGDLRDRASIIWSAQCLGRLDADLLIPLFEGRWLDGYDISGTFSRIRCPVLLLQADPSAGGALTDMDAQLAKDTIRSCEIVRFPGSGHLLHWLEPSRMGQLLNRFVSEIAQD